MKSDSRLSDRTQTMEVNVIREILKIASKPGMISLAGGIPAPESFPMDIISTLVSSVIQKYDSQAFQYGTTEGFFPLREALSRYLKQKEITASKEEIFISSGSQGVLDTLGKTLISRGDKIAVEAPTYLGAIQAFSSYGPEYVTIAMDENGVIPESLERVLKTNNIKFIYMVPTFQNPTGKTVPLERRKKIAELIKKNQALLVEDDPYSDLRYQGNPLPPIKVFAPDNVVYVGTLSKIFAPGLRIGFYIAPEDIRNWLVISKQGVDLHTSSFNQALAAEYLSGGYLDRQLPKIISIYKPKQEAMLQAMDRYMPDNCRWSKPQGGMFIWVEGPGHLDMETLYVNCVARNTAFVPGRYFFTKQGQGTATMRLNFTMADKHDLSKAIRILSEEIKKR